MVKKRGKKPERFKGVFDYLLKFALILVVYLVAGKLSLSLALYHPSASAIWMGTGIAIAALFLFGQRFWPAIFIASFLVNFTTEGTILTSLGIAIGNSLEGFFGAYFIKRYAGGNSVLDTPKNIFVMLVSIAIAGIISATIGVASLTLTGFSTVDNYIPVWLTWWIGNFTGAFILFPLIFSLSRKEKIQAKTSEIILILSVVVICALAVFSPGSPFAARHYPMPFVGLLAIVWASLRLGTKGTTISIFLTSIIAIFGTMNGFGPFITLRPNASLIFSQLYTGAIAFVGLVISSLTNK